MTVSADTILNPLEGIPSLLALQDLRERVRAALAGKRLDKAATVRLISADPFTVLRCLRFAHAPINGRHSELTSVAELVEYLGVPFVHRAISSSHVPRARTGAIRQLWAHSLATALAAQRLAEQGGDLPPEGAYMLGLLHDLHAWRDCLAAWRGQPNMVSARDWMARWNLPPTLRRMFGSGADVHPLVARAEQLANEAGLEHPGPDRPTLEGHLAGGHPLREELLARLREFGIESCCVEPPPEELAEADPEPLFRNKTVGLITELVLSLGACSRSHRSLGTLTATTAAALRYLGFDRAYFVRWSREQTSCWVRTKADLSPRPLKNTRVHLTLSELEHFRSAFAGEDPQIMKADPESSEGLLGLLGTDQVLLVPMNPEFEMPSLLVLDRSISGEPIDLEADQAPAKALANTSTLLIENLLLKRQRTRALKFALTDPLTRLANRGVGINSLRQEISRANRTGEPLTVLMLDLDKFKDLNDRYGHLTGDQALRSTAEVLRKTMRRMDTICRYGGEEFMVILPNTSLDEAAISAARIFTAVQTQGAALNLPLTVSIGIAAFNQGEDSVETLLARADRALYASKERGRNRFSVDVE